MPLLYETHDQASAKDAGPGLKANHEPALVMPGVPKYLKNGIDAIGLSGASGLDPWMR